jgi:hypothetical protein
MQMGKTAALLLLLFLTASSVALAQAQAASTVPLDLHLAKSDSAAAQKPFMAGLAMLHDFEYETAAQDFRLAESIDPGFCMAYWGEAMTYNHAIWYQQDRGAAQAALRKLGATEEQRLAKCGTERERDYLHAVDVLYFSKGTKYERDFLYSDAMAALYQKYPKDVDAGAFYALSILGTAHYGRDFRIYMRALAVLEPLFWAHPNNPGVDHYLIHSVDDPIHAPLGLAAARNYSNIPRSPATPQRGPSSH